MKSITIVVEHAEGINFDFLKDVYAEVNPVSPTQTVIKSLNSRGHHNARIESFVATEPGIKSYEYAHSGRKVIRSEQEKVAAQNRKERWDLWMESGWVLRDPLPQSP